MTAFLNNSKKLLYFTTQNKNTENPTKKTGFLHQWENDSINGHIILPRVRPSGWYRWLAQG